MPKALIVEDNRMNRKLLRDILEVRFTVMESETAEAALELLKTERPDIIFVDMQLPGMDGLSFTREMKSDESTAPIPIVAVSAHAMQMYIDQALVAGCTEYVTKPITEDPDQFADRMANLLTSD